MPLVQLLKGHPFTEGMPEALVKKLSTLARQVEFDEDEIVFRSGEKSMHFCLLQCGSAAVEIRTPYYGLCVETLGPGDAFGWSSLLDEHHTVFQVRAREPITAIFLDGRKLTEACRKDPKLGSEVFYRLARIVAKRVRATEDRLAEFCGSSKNHLQQPQPPESIR
jgi:CRP/FNR family transcriptional regulator, cyclic AMP receptor protein